MTKIRREMTNDDILSVLQSFVEGLRDSLGMTKHIFCFKHFKRYQPITHLRYISHMNFSKTILIVVYNFALDTNPDSVNSIVFPDEVAFILNKNVKERNCRYWGDTNLQWTLEAPTQHPLWVNV